MTGHEEDEEDYMNFVVIDEFHVKFGPAVSSISVAEALFCHFLSLFTLTRTPQHQKSVCAETCHLTKCINTLSSPPLDNAHQKAACDWRRS